MIYIISDGTKRTKIGYSKNPQRRLKQLQTGHPTKLRLYQTWEGDKRTEKLIHHILNPLRIRYNGEWFKATPEDCKDLIETILRKGENDDDTEQ